MNDELTEVRLGRNCHVIVTKDVPARVVAQVDDLRGRIDPSRYPYQKEGENAG